MNDGDRPSIFIIGAARSGTTWLQSMLAACPEISSPQETFLFSHYLRHLDETWQRQRHHLEQLAAEAPGGADPRDRAVGLPMLLSDDEFTEIMRAAFATVQRKALALKPGASMFLEKTPDHARHVGLISRVVPGCRFIHVIRDPYDSIRSNAYAPWNVDAGRPFRYYVVRWRRAVDAARTAERLGVERFLEVRYEDMQADAVQTLVRVAGFCGVEITSAEAQTIVGSVGPEGPFTVSGVAVQLGLGVTEPAGFSASTRAAPLPPLSPYERWLVERYAIHGLDGEQAGPNRKRWTIQQTRFRTRLAAEALRERAHARRSRR